MSIFILPDLESAVDDAVQVDKTSQFSLTVNMRSVTGEESE